MYLRGCSGSLVGTHISSEFKLRVCTEASWHQPELVVPSLVHTFRSLNLKAAAILLYGLTHLGFLELDVADIDVAHKITALQQIEVAVV